MKYILEETITQTEVLKSKFICYLIPVETEEQAKQHLLKIRKEHPKANHHCSAMVIDEIVRSSDDGEPASTAGIPMLKVLQGHNLNRVLAVVVRYFGGTLLGKGGLIRAYGHAVSDALEQTVHYQEETIDLFEVVVPYNMMSIIETQINEKATIIHRDFVEQAIFTLEVYNHDLFDELTNLTNGQISYRYQSSKKTYIAISKTTGQ